MDYKQMWLTLKKVVNQEYVTWNSLRTEDSEYFRGRDRGSRNEAQYILDEMEFIEELNKKTTVNK